MRKYVIPIIIVIFMVVAILFANMQEFLAEKIYPILPVNLCYLSYGEVNEGDYFVSIKDICFYSRASAQNDWRSCMQTYDPTGCLSSISSKSGIFMCDKLKDDKNFKNCLDNIISYTNLSIENEPSLAQYKVNKSVNLKNGEKFGLNPIEIEGDSVTYFFNTRRTCSGVQNPPRPENTVGGVGPWAFIYITKCEINGDTATIDYYYFNFTWSQVSQLVK